MRATGIDGPNKKIELELDMNEVDHLIAFLMHAKFSADVRHEIVGSPTMRQLLMQLLEAGRSVGETTGWFAGSETWEIREEGGLRAPASFAAIEARLKEELQREDVNEELAELLYPFTWIRRKP